MNTDPAEFETFSDWLMMDAQAGYRPWYFKCTQNGKDPISGVSWKAKGSQLTRAEAIEWLRRGGNVGVAGTDADPLTIVDLDGGMVTWNIDSLRDRSGSRCGQHVYTFSEKPKIPNIDTDTHGEVRSQWQYVIAPGSYVTPKPDPKKPCPNGEEQNLGRYTVEEPRTVKWITLEELPQIFIDTYHGDKQAEAEGEKLTRRGDVKHLRDGPHSALFDVEARDIVTREGGDTTPGKRWPALWHDSSTDANMSFSKEGLIHCWRHNVSLNGLQALVVMSGYLSCGEAGTPHKGCAGRSRVTGDDEAILRAWLYAKAHSYIPDNDPIPVRALHHIALKHLGYTAKQGEALPRLVYRRCLEIAEREY